MMRALFSAVSGLQAHQKKMDVIGNNIANVNTVAYKASRVTFSDILSQTLSSATGADSTSGRGGSNAKQIGLGVGIGSIDTLMTAGSTESTGNSTDLSIDGDGFFIVKNGSTGTYMFTRAGNFSIDDSGNLVTSDGLNVYGWLNYTVNTDGTYTFDTDSEVEAINLYSDEDNGNKQILKAQATANVSLSGNLDAGESAVGSGLSDIGSSDPEAQYTTTMTVYDSLGNEHELTVSFTKCYVDASGTDPVTTWYYSVAADSGDAALTDASGYLQFDSNGKLVTDDSSYSPTATMTVTPSSASGAGEYEIELDFSNLSTSADDGSVETKGVDGYPSGTLEDISIDSNGIILGVYSNGIEQPLGMIALARFANPSGLLKTGSNYYVATANSGEFTNGVMANGALSSGTLEMSNVDLSTEFSQMITTQRGYQANSRMITTADEMLETIIEMKR
ncbi:fagellar hook-basal body protein [Syntrophobotulus glycolicus DSM 8271]|uniref:Flagellar hook protein FlgE n=1 Tax=Syntrophobotulus glycolicus (strain DSM 8271 / FlGlyR) TaxID=645991 RepID=F0SU30_SYNGF|nr:flagellar hook protein FlgE [Syntrophobotulus glycolicus]ADY55413.1 fagellar hook-basal body protein [Syntrophobotulus glycolicus DSM 8271]